MLRWRKVRKMKYAALFLLFNCCILLSLLFNCEIMRKGRKWAKTLFVFCWGYAWVEKNAKNEIRFAVSSVAESSCLVFLSAKKSKVSSLTCFYGLFVCGAIQYSDGVYIQLIKIH